MMTETQTIAAKLGISFQVHRSRSASRARSRVGHHKTSMLQDVEAGRPALETDALLGHR